MALQRLLSSLIWRINRFAIGNAERPLLRAKIGWLDHLANATHQFYTANNTGGPGIKVAYTSSLLNRLPYIYVKDTHRFALSYSVALRDGSLLHLQ